MHLLYLDDSGAVGNANEQYLVLGGVSVFETQSHWITQELDKLAETINPGDPHGVEFHASETFARRRQPWKGLSQDDARGTIKAVLDVLANARDTARAFACVVHKDSYPGLDPMEIAFEDLCSRFDRYLRRLRAGGDTQRGLVILDKSAHETTLQQMSVEFRTLGTQWGVIRNLADTPLFVDSRASRVRVPLCRRAAEILEAARTLGDGSGPLVFPNGDGTPLPEKKLRRLLQDRNIAAVPHGFRSTFRDWATERTNHPREVVEAALVHMVHNKVETAYARSDLFERRRRLMDEWAAYVDGTHPRSKLR